MEVIFTLICRGHGHKEDLSVLREVSFECLQGYDIIVQNILQTSFACVRDVNFVFIVILGDLKKVIVGPFQVIGEFANLCIVEDTLGIHYIVDVHRIISHGYNEERCLCIEACKRGGVVKFGVGPEHNCQIYWSQCHQRVYKEALLVAA